MNYARFFNALPVKIVIYTLATLAGLAAFTGLVLPSILAWQAPVQIKTKSDHDLVLGKPSINPFLLRVTIPETSLSKPAGEPLVSFNTLTVDISFTRLFKGEIEVTQFQADGLNLTVALEEGDRTNWQDLVDAFASGAEPASEEPKPNAAPPAFELVKFALSNGQVNFEDRRTPGGYQTTITPIDIELENLSTISNEEGDFALEAQSQAGAKFRLAGEIDALLPGVQGEFAIENFDLLTVASALEPLLPVVPPEGIFNLNGSFDVKAPPSGLELAITQGASSLTQLKVQSKGDKPSQAQLESLAIKGASYVHQSGTASIEQITLQGFDFNTPAKDKVKSLARFKDIQINQVAVDLNQQDAKVANVTMNGLGAEIQRLKNGELTLLNAVNQFTQSPAQATAPSQVDSVNTAPEETEPSKPWTWSVGQIAIKGGQANYQDESFSPKLSYGIRGLNISTQNVSQNLSRALPVSASLSVVNGGDLNVQASVVPNTGHVDADLTLKGLSVAHAQPFLTPVVRLDIQSGSVFGQGKIKVRGSDASFKGDVRVNSFRLNRAGTRDAFFMFDALKLSRVSAGTAGATVDRILLSGLDTRVAIAQDKSTNLDALMVKNESAPPAATQEPSGKPFPVQINRFSIANSQLEFEDRSLFIPFGTQIQKLEGVVTGISTRPDASGEVELSGQVGEFGLANAQGQVAFMDPTKQLDINVLFKNLAMEDLTPYTATFANRKINSGKLNLELNYKIEDRALASTNRVIVEQLKLGERVESPDAVDLPLDLAVAILEDSNGVIDLGLPITGSLDDPQFSIGSIVLKTIQNVLTNIVTAPFRALGSLFGGDDSLGNITFTAGKGSLSPPEKESVVKLAQALQKRPNLKLEVQGTWSDQDRIALQKQSLRTKVAAGLGIQLEPGENPGPIATQEENTQKVLEDLFKDQFGTGEFLSIKDGYKKVNPDQLNEGLGSALTGGVVGVFADKRELSDKELEQLKGKNFFDVLRDRLQQAQMVEDQSLIELGNTRSDLVVKVLQENNIASERLSSAEPVKIETEPKQGIGLNLGLGS